MIKFIPLNIRRVKKKENLLIQLVKENEGDVILLQETYLTSKYECKQFLENLRLKMDILLLETNSVRERQHF